MFTGRSFPVNIGGFNGKRSYWYHLLGRQIEYYPIINYISLCTMDVHLNSSQFPIRAPNQRKSPMPHQCLDFPRTCLVARSFTCLLAGKSPLNGSFKGKIIYKWCSFPLNDPLEERTKFHSTIGLENLMAWYPFLWSACITQKAITWIQYGFMVFRVHRSPHPHFRVFPNWATFFCHVFRYYQ